ncbi:hypothetical protein ACMAY5_12700 [Arenicellales bacterium nBUS_48]
MPSRFATKVLANSLLAGISIVMLALLFVSFHHDEILERFGSEWVNDYAQSMKQEAITAFSQAKKTNQTSPLIALLEKAQWEEVLLDDRAYPLKRALLLRLCLALEQQENYGALRKWSLSWLSLSDRDLDARAFWYEAIRHSPGEEDEGLRGLITNQHAFPENNYLSQFLIKAYRETDNYELADQLLQETMNAEAKSALEDWRIYWTTPRQKSFSEVVSKPLGPKFNHQGQLTLVTHIPADSILLRVDPPRGSRIRIYQIEVQTDQRTIRFHTSILKFNQLRREKDSLIADGKPDPQFYLPIRQNIEPTDREQVTVSIRCYVDVIVGEDEIPLVDFFDQT